MNDPNKWLDIPTAGSEQREKRLVPLKDMAALQENEGRSTMELYQMWVRSASWYVGALSGSTEELVYLMLGLSGEVGETADVIKKTVRTEGTSNWPNSMHAALGSTGRRDTLIEEIGDVLWYMAGLLGALGLTFEQVAEMNQTKLIERLKEHD